MLDSANIDTDQFPFLMLSAVWAQIKQTTAVTLLCLFFLTPSRIPMEFKTRLSLAKCGQQQPCLYRPLCQLPSPIINHSFCQLIDS